MDGTTVVKKFVQDWQGGYHRVQEEGTAPLAVP
jgi:hypothetical protein